MRPVRVGFVGFGEVASIFSATIRARGADVSAYDVNLDRPGGEARLKRRIGAEGIRLAPLDQVVTGADVVLSTVRGGTAMDAARACAPCLREGHTFVDLNSTSPKAKIEIHRLVQPSGAAFVEGAILGAVGASGASTRILIGGEHGQSAAETLTSLGLRATFYSPEIGKASVFKLLRGIFSKGLEALLLELLLAGRRAGIAEDLWEDVSEFMTQNPFEKVGSNWIRTHPAACERRHQEMGEILETIRAAGADPVVTGAVEALFRRSSELGLKEDFAEKPGDLWAVVEALDGRLGRKG